MLEHYVAPPEDTFGTFGAVHDDNFSFFVGRLGLMLALLSPLLAPRSMRRAAVTLYCLGAVFLLLTTGIYAPLPRILFALHFPAIDVFRQWFHFFPMLNFCLSALAALGIAGLASRGEAGRGRALYWTAATLLFVLNAADLGCYAKTYTANFSLPEAEAVRFSEAEAALPHLMQYRDHYALEQQCGRRLARQGVFLTRAVALVSGGGDEERDVACTLSRRSPGAVTVAQAQGAPPPPFGIRFATGTDPSLVSSTEPVGGFVEPKEAGDSLSFHVVASRESLLVLPINHALAPAISVDGKRVDYRRVNGFAIGIVVAEGTHDVQVVGPAFFKLSGMLQLGLYVFLTIFFARRIRLEDGADRDLPTATVEAGRTKFQPSYPSS
jgi:hypothetical protein